mmetsp:Transcript_1110/g.2340  ORF Transcript_1110/g.2340 Transcript_1110/m.2340 type:complete len:311 (-) Transcript_1110:106-1038(-)
MSENPSYGALTPSKLQVKSNWATTEQKGGLSNWAKQLISVIIFYLVGCLYYGFAETQWDPLTVFYFCCVSITTIGYGDVTPTTDTDKLFTVFYITVGLSVVFTMIANAVDALFSSIEEADEARVNLNTAGELPPDDKDVYSRLRHKTGFYIGLVVLIMILGGIMICFLEGWTFISGLYWAFQTTTTVGYGDETLTHSGARFTAGCYALFSVGAVGGAFAGVASAKEEANLELRRRDLLRRPLDIDMILGMDQNGDGVDRAEFVVGMLVAMGLAKEEDCAPLMARFDELDSDRSGRLDKDDLRMFAFGKPL